MEQVKTLVLYPEDLKEDSKLVETFYATLEDFNRVQESKYKLILFMDTRPETNILYSTRVLKNILITEPIKNGKANL
jgi:hypothetical protein